MFKVLLVDDDENILQGYRRNLRNKFQIYTSHDPRMALSILRETNDIAAIISDYNMPEMNGIELLTLVKDISPDTVRILITGYADLQMAIKAVNEGNLFRFLTKPCEQEELQRIIMQGCEHYRLINSEKELLDKTLRGSIKVLIDILAAANPTVFQKSLQIRDYAKKLMKRLNIAESWEVEIACLLSQIGCVGIPGEILEKRLHGIELNNSEKEVFFNHVEIGKSLLKNIPRLELVAEGISMQHLSINEIIDKSNVFVNDSQKFIPKVLRILTDYYYLVEKGMNEQDAIKCILEEKQEYDLSILEVLETEIAGAQVGFIVKSVKLSELKSGMTIATDIIDNTSYKILSKGVVLTDVYILKLLNYSKIKGIKEPIKVITKFE